MDDSAALDPLLCFLPAGHTHRLALRAGAAVQVIDGRAGITSRRWLAQRLVVLAVDIDSGGVFTVDDAGWLDLHAAPGGPGLRYTVRQPPGWRGLFAQATRRLRDDVARAASSAQAGLRAVLPFSSHPSRPL